MLIDRRQFLASGYGVGGIALASLLQEQGLLGAPALLGNKNHDTTPKMPNSFGRAKAMISMFMQGGPSHMDLFDPKPELTKYDGKDFPGEVKYDDAAGASRECMGSPWKFKKHGQSGMDVSELLPHFSKIDHKCSVSSITVDMHELCLSTSGNCPVRCISAHSCTRVTEAQFWKRFVAGS